MKLFLLTFLVGCACADVSHILKNGESNAEIVRQELDVSPDGTYQWAFETQNGISARAQGGITNPGAENAAQAVQGDASWVAPDGETIKFEYVADENGYQPQGSHLPTPPPIPEAILRALAYIQAHPPAPEKK